MDKGYQLALCTSLMSQQFGWLQHCFHITAMYESFNTTKDDNL